LGKIIISDLDNQIKKVMKWTGGGPLYIYTNIANDGALYHSLSTNYSDFEKISDKENIKQYNYGEDVGYILTDFTYPG